MQIKIPGPDLYIEDVVVLPDVIEPPSSNVFFLTDEQKERFAQMEFIS